jgi:hypothetical protein
LDSTPHYANKKIKSMMIYNSGGESFWKATMCKTKEMVGKYLDRTSEDAL